MFKKIAVSTLFVMFALFALFGAVRAESDEVDAGTIPTNPIYLPAIISGTVQPDIDEAPGVSVNPTDPDLCKDYLKPLLFVPSGFTKTVDPNCDLKWAMVQGKRDEANPSKRNSTVEFTEAITYTGAITDSQWTVMVTKAMTRTFEDGSTQVFSQVEPANPHGERYAQGVRTEGGYIYYRSIMFVRGFVMITTETYHADNIYEPGYLAKTVEKRIVKKFAPLQ